MPEQTKDLSQGSWRWNGFEWVPSDAPVVEPKTAAERLGWSPRALIAIAAAVGVVIVGSVGVAVGFHVTTKPRVDPATRMTAAQIVAASAEQVRTTDSYHLTGTSSDDNETFAVSQQDPTTVEIDDSIGALTAKLIETDGRSYVSANAAFYKKYSPQLQVIADRWLIFPQQDSPKPLKAVDDFRNNLVCSMNNPEPWQRAADTTIAGTPVRHVYVAHNGDRVDLYIASQGLPYLIRVQVAITSNDVTVAYHGPDTAVSGRCVGGVGANRPGTNAHYQIDFDHWGDEVRVGVPSEPIPLIDKPTTS